MRSPYCNLNHLITHLCSQGIDLVALNLELNIPLDSIFGDKGIGLAEAAFDQVLRCTTVLHPYSRHLSTACCPLFSCERVHNVLQVTVHSQRVDTHPPPTLHRLSRTSTSVTHTAPPDWTTLTSHRWLSDTSGTFRTVPWYVSWLFRVGGPSQTLTCLRPSPRPPLR